MTPTAFLAIEPLGHLIERTTALLDVAATTGLDLLLAGVVLLFGWGVATLFARVTLAFLRVFPFNPAVRALLTAGGEPLRHEPAAVASWAVYWTVLVLVLSLALQLVGVQVLAPVAERLAEVLPRVVVAAVVLAAGIAGAMALGAITRRFFQTGNLAGARLRGQIVTWTLTGFAVLLALEQLGFAAQFVMTVGLLAVGALALALGLAFGLGCRDLARDFVVEFLRSLEDERGGRPS